MIDWTDAEKLKKAGIHFIPGKKMAKVYQFPYRQKAYHNLPERTPDSLKEEAPKKQRELPPVEDVKAFNQKMADHLFREMYAMGVDLQQEGFPVVQDVAMAIQAMNAILCKVFGLPHPMHKLTVQYFLEEEE